MRQTCTVIVLVLTGLMATAMPAWAQFGLGFGYLNSQPTGLMGQYIRAAHGLALEGTGKIRNSPLSVGLNLSYSAYGFQSREGYYFFENGYQGVVDIEITNQFTLISPFLRLHLSENHFIQPYVQAGFGMARFWTSLEILDPREEFTSDCPKPLESDVLLSERTFQTNFAAGVQMDFSKIIKSLDQNVLRFDLRATYTRGGEVHYMSLDAPASSGNQTLTQNGENVSIPFASENQPDVVHQYHAGRSYRTALQTFGLQAGLFYYW